MAKRDQEYCLNLDSKSTYVAEVICLQDLHSFKSALQGVKAENKLMRGNLVLAIICQLSPYMHHFMIMFHQHVSFDKNITLMRTTSST